MSRDVLDDLVADVPRHVVPDADRAWRAGTARRRRRYAVEGLAVAAAVALVGAGLVRLHDQSPVQPVDKGAKLAGYPGTVPSPWREEPLPDPSGRLAGAMEVNGDWYGVDDRGRSWRLPAADDHFVALSDDGSELGYLRSEGPGKGHYETVDLTTGAVQTYPDVGEGTTENDVPVTDQPYWSGMQQPAYWSPDGARLVVPGGRMESEDVRALLLENGAVTTLDVPGFPVGWESATTIVWLAHDGRSVRISDLDGNVVREVALQRNRPHLRIDQWSGRVSPDGSQLALVDEVLGGKARLWTFSLLDGTTASGGPAHPALPDLLSTKVDPVACPPAWLGDRVALWAYDGLYDGSTDVRVIEARGWDYVTCGTWAEEALAGPAQAGVGPLESRYWPVERLWPWVLGVALGGVVVGLWWFRRRRSRATSPAS
jgi:hypothetical protein